MTQVNMLQEIVAGYVQYQHGSSIRNQFIETFMGSEGFDEQNVNALKYIKISVKDILEANLLKDDSELKEYYENLEDYLKNL